MCNTGRGPPPRNPRPGHITRRIGPPVPSPLLTGPVLPLCRCPADLRRWWASPFFRRRTPPRHLPYYNSQGRYRIIATGEGMWRLDEDPANGIPDAGVALRGASLCHSLGVHGDLLYTRRRHRGRRGLGTCGDALGGLEKVGVQNLGYPLWLLVAVLVVLGVLTFYMLRGRVSDGMLVPLTIVLAPVCAVVVVAVAVLISALLSPFYEAPSDPVQQKPERTPAATPEPTSPATTGPTVSPTPSPSASPSASPSVSPSAVPSASATASASASPA